MVIVKRCLRRQCNRPVLVEVTRNVVREIEAAAPTAECRRCKVRYEVRLADSGRDIELLASVDPPTSSAL